MFKTASVFFFRLAVAVTLSAIALSSFDPVAAQDGDEKQPAAKRPNVVFIIVDDQRRQEFGFIESKALTPNIDRLANEGTYFRNGFAASTVCTPSRYSCLTGRYPSQCSEDSFTRDITPEGMTVVGFNTHVEPDRPNIPNVLQHAGYQTGYVGKWHVGLQDYREEVPPPGSDAANPDVAAMLSRNQKNLEAAMKKFGFDFAARIYAGNALDSQALKNSGCTHHNMEWLTEGALEFLDHAGKQPDKPFYLYFSTTLTHWPEPITSLKADWRMTAGGLLKEPITVQPDRASVLQRVREAGLPESVAGATWLDDGVGAIMRKLEDMQIADNTMIVYFNDHGMEHDSKNSLYYGATRTPIMCYWPGTVKPQVRDEIVQNVDFAATILDAGGVAVPKEMETHGLSFLPIAKGEAVSKWREFAYSELGYTRAITGKRWKYLAFRLPTSASFTREESIRLQTEFLAKVKEEHPWVKWEVDPEAKISHTGGIPGGDFLNRLTFAAQPPYLKNYYHPDQLYDLKNDPLESVNLAEDPQHAEKLREMQAKLISVLNELPGTFAELKPKAE